MFFRSKQNKENLSNDFIEFFKSYFKGENFTDDMSFNLRYYMFLLQTYIEHLKIPNEELINAWKNEIKPFLFEKYPFEKDGIFNVNADIHYLINYIDDLIKKAQLIIINKELSKNKDNMIKVPSNDSIKRRDSMKNFDIKFDDLKSEEEQDEFENDLEIIKIDTEEELMNNKNIINDEKKSLKRNASTGNLKSHSPTIASKSTAVSINDELNNINNNDLELKSSISLNYKIKAKEITPKFSDEFETEGTTIVYKKGVIAQMTYNLFLKKIVTSNFIDDYFEYTFNFIEQCFFFMKREIVFKKIINCYEYYKDLEVPFIQRKKLIHFMNILVIKLYECYPRIEYQDNVLTIIKTFYNSLIKDLKLNSAKSKKRVTSIQEFLYSGINAIKSSVENIKEKNKNEIEKKVDKSKFRQSLSFFFGNRKTLKEDEPKKQKNNIEKKEDENKENKEKELTPEEEVINECEQILALFKTEVPKEDLLAETERNLYIYKLKIKKQNTKKTDKKNSKKEIKKLTRCNTERLTFNTIDEKDVKEIYKTTRPYFSCINYDTKEIGEELIHVSKLGLTSIKRKELYNGAFSKKSKKITSPNVGECINKFDKLISFIVEDILSYDYAKDRANMIDKWASVADYCRTRNDYNDTLAIYIALKKGTISGLDLTWGMISHKTKKIIKNLDELCSFLGNYKNIRNSMKSLNKNTFYIPYLGILLKDINFYEENYKYIVNGYLINFEKINKVQNTLDEFFYFQKVKDRENIKLVEELNFFENLEVQTEDHLNNVAGKLEPTFELYLKPKKAKRLTNIDKKYFAGHYGKNHNSSKRQSCV